MSKENPDTRTRALRTAWKLLEEGGSGVRMADIAKAAGISRQALYLHFPSRAELLVATTRYIDDVKKVDDRLARSRAATTGPERLEAYIDAWGGYIPEIYPVAAALIALQDHDQEARFAWEDRMQAMREGCEAAVKQLKNDELLIPGFTLRQATDLLWTLLSIENWRHLVVDCGWSQKRYIEQIKQTARATLMVQP